MRTGIIRRLFRLPFALALLLTPLTTGTATGQVLRVGERIRAYFHAALLPHSDQFLAHSAPDVIALYRLKDRRHVRSFGPGTDVESFAVTSDEKILVLADESGGLSAYDLATGHLRWAQPCWEGLPGPVNDVSCSPEGRFVIAHKPYQAVIYETATGKRVNAIRFHRGGSYFAAAALCPNGQAVFVDTDEYLYTFDVATGKVTKKQRVGKIMRIRSSVDGKYVALYWIVNEGDISLRIVAAGGDWPFRDCGPPDRTVRLEPAEDGGFLLTQLDGDAKGPRWFVGRRWRPGAESLEELWRWPVETLIQAYLPDQMIGLATDDRLVTHLTDLRTGAELGRVDNSANYHFRRPSTTNVDRGGWLLPLCVAAVFVAIAWGGIVRFRRNAPKPPPPATAGDGIQPAK